MRKSIFCLRMSFLSVFLILVCFAGSQATAASGVYPVEPEKGIQSISYTISGANLGSYHDTMDPGLGRLYKGTLGDGTLRAQGIVTSNEYLRSARIIVSIQLGGGVDSNLESEVQVDLGTSEQKKFDISVAIPTVLTDAINTYGANVAISVVVDNYIGEYGPASGRLTVSALIDAPSTTPGNHPPTVSLSYTPAQPIVGSPIELTATASDADGDTLSYAWYLDGALQSGAKTATVNWAQPPIGAHSLKIVVSDGKGGEGEAVASFTVTNPDAEPYVIAPGYQEGEGEPWGFVDKVIINGQEVSGIEQTLLYTGSLVKTGPGVEILLRTSYGAVTRVNESSTYEVEVRKLETTSTIDVVGRLKDGVGDFYWPPGHAGAEKFEVETSRIVVGIKGTIFTVSQNDDNSTVSVQEGVVQVTNLDTGVVSQVEAGDSLTAADTGVYNFDFQDGIDGPYVGNGYGTVVDKGTLLMWQQKFDGNVMTWYDACSYCNDLTLAGYSDWLLPDVYQLGSLLDNNFSQNINTDYFPDIKSDWHWYWSGSAYADTIGRVWGVNFDVGNVSNYEKSAAGYVRCVRSDTSEPCVPPPAKAVVVAPTNAAEISASPVQFYNKALVLDFQSYCSPVDIYVAILTPNGTLVFVNSNGELTHDFDPYATGIKDGAKASFSVENDPLAFELSGEGSIYWLVAPSTGGDITYTLGSGAYELGGYNVTLSSFMLL